MRFPLALVVALAPLAALRAQGATVSGIVYDSLAQAPLTGAAVQLASADADVAFGRTTISDSLGRFRFDSVPDGHYLIGFLHPFLDSLGVDAPLRELHVVRGRPFRLVLAVPSAKGIRLAICGVPADAAAGAVIMGVVRDVRAKEPLGNVTVVGEWLELDVTRQGTVRRVPRLEATTAANGWYALCGVPSDGSVALIARHGGDSTDLIEVTVPAHGFLRRDLHLGGDHGAGGAAARVTRIDGVVVSDDGARPIPHASVRVIGSGMTVRADAQGRFTLAGAPTGTRALEVHAIGYFPGRFGADLIDGAGPLLLTLSNAKQFLDTVLITSRQTGDPLRSGFLDRRRVGLGRYVTEEEIARFRPIYVTDILRRMPGLYLEREAGNEISILMRGTFTDRCTPSFYINGRYMRGLTASELDLFAPTDRITGVEVYSGTIVPPQFEPGLSGCGSIVVWTR